MSQPIFWTPQSHNGVVILVAAPPELDAEDASATPIEVSAAIASEDGLHLRYRFGSLDAQLLILAGNDPSRPLAALVPLDVDGLDRIAAIERLLRTLHGRAIPAGGTVTAQQRTSLKQMLRAVDGRSARANQREIAAALFGAFRVADHPWKSSPLRDKVNRLVRGGNAMIDGGYRKLLRRNQRS